MGHLMYYFEISYIDKNGRSENGIIPYDDNNLDRLKRELRFDLSCYGCKHWDILNKKGKSISVPIASMDIEGIKYLGVYG